MRGALLALPLCVPGAAGPFPAQSSEELTARLDQYLGRAAAFGFSGVVLVGKQGQIVHCKGYGLADRARGAPFTADTAFDLASVTKQFTAAAVLKLEMMGKLRTDDPIGKFLGAVPEDKAKITLHHLLTHTSGLERGEGDRTTVLSRDEMLALILETPRIAEVGEKFSYSNWGYTVLAAVIERASGQTFQSFLREQFFEPLGMSRTGFYGDSTRWPPETVAHSYFETAEEGRPLDWPLTWMATGGGGVLSTAPDLYRWDCELRSGRILSAEAKQELVTGYVRADGPFEYGYGWHVGGAPGARLAFHAGYNKSFGCEYRRYLDQDTTVFVATNVGYLGGTGQQVALTEPIARIALGKQQPMPPPVVSLDEGARESVCGVYRMASGSCLRVSSDRGRLSVEAEGQEAFDALFYADRGQAPDFTEPNSRTLALVEALKTRDRAELVNALDSSDVESYAPMLESVWGSLVTRFGKLQRCEVLGTAPYPFNDGDVRTYAELEFERAGVIVTAGFRGGAFFDLTTWEGAPNPSAVALAPLSRERFTTYDLWTSKQTTMELRSGPGGEVTELILDAHGRRIHASRIK